MARADYWNEFLYTGDGDSVEMANNLRDIYLPSLRHHIRSAGGFTDEQALCKAILRCEPVHRSLPIGMLI